MGPGHRSGGAKCRTRSGAPAVHQRDRQNNHPQQEVRGDKWDREEVGWTRVLVDHDRYIQSVDDHDDGDRDRDQDPGRPTFHAGHSSPPDTTVDRASLHLSR